MKIQKYPVSLKQRFIERRIQKKAAPFAHIERGGNKAFDSFMNQADSLASIEKQILKETELFNKAILKDKKLLSLSEKVNNVPRTPQQIAEYKEISGRLLNVAEKCGAVHLHQNMKIAFNLMLENSKNLNIRI